MVFLILAQIMIAINIVFAKILLESIPILVMLTIRFCIASFILLPLHWLSPAAKLPLSHHFSQLKLKDWLFILAEALAAGVLFNCLMLMGLNNTDANVAGIITSALPVIIALMSCIFLKEKLSGKTIVCILIATLGLVVLAYDKVRGVELNHSLKGDLLVFISLIPEAGYYIMTKIHPTRLPIFLVSSILNGINALILIALLAYFQLNVSNISMENWCILLALGLTAGLFYVFWLFGSQRIEGIKASLSTAAMPVATVILAWALLSEQLSGTQLLGMGLVILSILGHGF